APLFDGKYTDDAGEWLGVKLSHSRFSFSADRLKTWRNVDCPVLGRKLRAQFIDVLILDKRGARRAAKRWVYHAEDLAQIAGGMIVDPQWPCGDEAATQYGWSKG